MLNLNLKDISENSIFLVAVSGGADSMALLSFLFSSASSVVNNIHVLHVNHNLRGEESNADADFVRSFCEERDIPCKIVNIPPGKIESYAKKNRTGLEAAARYYRRKALIKEAKKIEKNNSSLLILTAHTKDDVTELLLMRIFKGAGPAGLAGMPVRKGRFLRPLLDVSKKEIIEYLKEKKIPWREDSSNKDNRFLRNKIRNELIPFLDEFLTENTEAQSTQRGNWRKGLENLAFTQSLVAEFLNSEANNRIVWEGNREKGAGNRLITDEINFFNQLQIIREESIYNALNIIRFNSVPKNPKRSVIRRFCKGEIKSCDLGRVRITRENGQIIITLVKKDHSESGISILIK